MLEVVEAGVLTSIQDAGRPDWTHLGVPVGGACDPWSLAVANLLVGNDAGAAAVEMTLVGGTFAVRTPVTVGLAGADMGGVVRESGRPLATGRTHLLEQGWTIAFPGVTDSTARSGARAYLAMPGGVDVPSVLGSASTALGAGFGGIDGRRLQAGDVVRAREPKALPGHEAAWPALDDDPLAAADSNPIRVLPGPASGLAAILRSEWTVGAASDRVGLRLEGPPPLPAASSGEMLSHGVVRGAIQLPPGGGPIVLLADHQTTGGYPIAAVVITADHPRLGQLRPGSKVRFTATTIDDARLALVHQKEALARGGATIRAGATWDELWQSAGG